MGIGKKPWRETVHKSFKFALHPKYWLPVFVCDFVFFLIGLFYIVSNASGIASLFEAMSAGPASMVSVGGFATVTLAFFAAWMLVRIWVQGGVIRLSQKGKDYTECFKYSLSRYLHMLVATLILTALSTVFGFVPYFGTLLSLVISIMFFFMLQGVIVKKLDFWSALKDSYGLFRKQTRKFRADTRDRFFQVWLAVLLASAITTVYSIAVSPDAVISASVFWVMIAVLSGLIVYSKVSDMWAIVGVVSIIISVIFLLIGSAILSAAFLSLAAGEGAVATAAILLAVQENMAVTMVSGIVILIGIAISTTFALKSMTEFYIQLKKKFIFF